MRRLLIAAAVGAFAAAGPTSGEAGMADVLDVEADAGGGGTWRFTVTVRHGDTGWDHYADQWQVLGPDDTILGTRTLHHPHVGEQPFTRSLSGVSIPDDVDQVTIRARDSVHGHGGATVTVNLDR
jgi:hypothetical protein